MKRLVMILLAACGTPRPPPVEPAKPPPPPPPAVVEWTKLVGPIKAVEVVTPDATIAPKAKEVLAGAVGKALDRRELRKVLTTVLALPGVSDVSAEGKQLADGIQIIVDIVPQPTLHALAARAVGGPDLPLPGQLTAAIGLPINPELLDALGAQLRVQFLTKGYTDATVEWKQTPAGTGAVDVAVEITPGKASIITTVDFKGNAHMKKADLVKAIGDGFAPNSPWSIDTVDRGQIQLASYYYDHGYINVAVEEPKPSGGPAPAIYAITEGDQYRVGKLEVSGASAADSKKFLGLLHVKKGEIFNRTAITTGIGKITSALHANGGTAYVTPITNVDTKKKVIDIKLEVATS
jgi:outer membrane protein insertion porin family